MPLQATSGAASYDAFGGGVVAEPNYIESVFSTYLYAGNSGTQSIVNGIDLSTKGGLVWVKNRGVDVNHQLSDTVNGMTFTSAKYLRSNLDSAISDNGPNFQRADSVGFTWGTDSASSGFNLTGNNYVSWTFREQPKFFDVVTYTGTGSNTTIAHSLGSVPGSIIVKRTDTTAAWAVYHRSLANTEYLVLNSTAAKATGATRWNSTTPTDTVFSLGTDATVNASGGTYVAYLFAHDAGGFGLTGTDNVISCGSFTTDGSGNATVSLGYEPQWVLYKGASGTGGASDWVLADTMRGYAFSGGKYLAPNSSQTEGGLTGNPTATGFVVSDTINTTYIYIAIRRGPMKVPTLGTSVFSPNVVNAPLATKTTVGFPIDLQIFNYLPGDGGNSPVLTRLAGVSTNSTSSGSLLKTSSTAAESSAAGFCLGWDNTGFQMPSGYTNSNVVFYNFGRAPGFFDEVCYTGDDADGRAVTHNLTTTPELIIVKSRSASAAPSWWVWNASTSGGLILNSSDAASIFYWSPTDTPTTTTFKVSRSYGTNYVSATYVAYLFATCAGVSKIGSYTGTGTTQTINCGFTGGARFVLIKRTDSTGDWYVWDSARGIVAGNDPYLLLNSTAAEVTSTDYIDTASTGFEISSTAPAAINASAGTFIFLAIA
jgi:hypothetical protein